MTFGRRSGLGTNTRRAPLTEVGRARVHLPAPHEAVAITTPPSEPSVDDELQAWKLQRRRSRAYRLPWRQLLLVGSLSFFIASFVLPASVNGTVDWLLDSLSVVSLLAWVAGGRKAPCEPSRPSAEGRKDP